MVVQLCLSKLQLLVQSWVYKINAKSWEAAWRIRKFMDLSVNTLQDLKLSPKFANCNRVGILVPLSKAPTCKMRTFLMLTLLVYGKIMTWPEQQGAHCRSALDAYMGETAEHWKEPVLTVMSSWVHWTETSFPMSRATQSTGAHWLKWPLLE